MSRDAPSYVSDQLELNLFPCEPWGGRSPRALTRVGSGFILNQEVPEAARFFVDPEQLMIWAVPTAAPSEGPRRYGGAPSLLPLLSRSGKLLDLLREE